ncbi:MAG: hypothetical protein KI792_08375 [Alphaproteobacteria bacterium]|nr:hypothetical protein [Alphaproteobacteria bacterium SS10]
MTADADKPELAIFHSLARTGCTIFSRYVGAMDGVYLYSEIHPDGPPLSKSQTAGTGHLALSALVQAAAHGLDILENPEDLLTVGALPNSLEQLSQVIEATKTSGNAPVLRDWSHIDWHGRPFCVPAGGTGALVALLEPHYRLKRAVWVRHPMACYMSIAESATLGTHYRGEAAFDQYIEGWLGFVADNPLDRVVRYEEFLPDPAAAIQKLCQYLDIPFDPQFAAKAAANTNITGDDRAKAEVGLSLFQRPMPVELWDYVRAHQGYQSLVAQLGYDLDELPLGFALLPRQ